MKTAYFFAINETSIGPLDEPKIKERIALHDITRDTLAWREGMDSWQPVHAIPELLEFVEQQLNKAAKPPPLPGAYDAGGKAAPPPLPETQRRKRRANSHEQMDSSSAPGKGKQTPDDLSDLTLISYQLLQRLLSKRSPLRTYIERNPRMSMPIVVAALLGLLLILAYLIDTQTEETAFTEPPQQIGAPMGDWQSRHRAWQETQRYTQGIRDDVYKRQLEAEDRRDEAYRRATYDWHRDDKD